MQAADTLENEIIGNLIIVTGLPGSGKTTYLDKLKKHNYAAEYFDDFQKNHYDSPDPKDSPYYSNLIHALNKGSKVVVSDIRYCVQEELNRLLVNVLSDAPNASFEIHYGSFDALQATKNIKKRNREESLDAELDLAKKFSEQVKPIQIKHFSSDTSA